MRSTVKADWPPIVIAGALRNFKGQKGHAFLRKGLYSAHRRKPVGSFPSVGFILTRSFGIRIDSRLLE
jgi:hypothetical protein